MSYLPSTSKTGTGHPALTPETMTQDAAFGHLILYLECDCNAGRSKVAIGRPGVAPRAHHGARNGARRRPAHAQGERSGCRSATSDRRYVQPQEIASGVWGVRDHRIWLVLNIGIILGRDAALVVDTGLGPANGQSVVDLARRLAGNRRLLLTLTHLHPHIAMVRRFSGPTRRSSTTGRSGRAAGKARTLRSAVSRTAKSGRRQSARWHQDRDASLRL